MDDKVAKELRELKERINEILKLNELYREVIAKVYQSATPPNTHNWHRLRFDKDAGILEFGEHTITFATSSKEYAVLGMLFYDNGKPKKRIWFYDELAERLNTKRYDIKPKQIPLAVKRIRAKAKDEFERDDIFVSNSEKIFINRTFTIL